MNDDIMSRIRRNAMNASDDGSFDVITLDEYVSAVSNALMPGKKVVEFLSGSDVRYLRSKSIATSGFVVAVVDDSRTVSGIDASGNSLGTFSMPCVTTLDALYGFDPNRKPAAMSVGSGAVSALRRVLNVDDGFELVIVEKPERIGIAGLVVATHRAVGSAVSVFVRQADMTDDVVVFIDGDLDVIDPGETRWRLAGPASLAYAGIVVVSNVVGDPRPRCDRINVDGKIVNRVHMRAIDCASIATASVVMLDD